MPEMGEPITVDEVASIEHDDYCYFCSAKEEPRVEENEFPNDYDEDLDLDGEFNAAFKNDAGTLGKALGASPPRQIEVGTESKDVIAAAHHLIPGNASLANSKLFKSSKYLWKDGRVRGNIGYNINSSANGVWLPGNYAVRPWSTKPLFFKREYAFAAMEAYQAQFHDAHQEYSNFVLAALDQVYDKLDAMKSIWCPEQKKKAGERDPEKDYPLYALVGRLNSISGRMRGLLTGTPEKSWRLNVYTSRFALLLMMEKQSL
ncbi:MAG TPA: AHH domain-containing protein [Archangium sp.]|uniref:AHH domain-containing protein n=1 Tax=Archangium sp. TaxID=1872627 RepID=UPI002E3746E3|nr:AHH domain-containing protein [Archangium sp.]HEX5751197.1 AHH domain-containing protein [Archangium sp.]